MPLTITMAEECVKDAVTLTGIPGMPLRYGMTKGIGRYGTLVKIHSRMP